MSIKTWLAEYVPEDSNKTSIQKSQLKWIGLQPENMQRHGVFWSDPDSDEIQDDEGHTWEAYRCSLCDDAYEKRHLAFEMLGEPRFISICGYCPLARERAEEGGHYVPCDDERSDEQYSPWGLRQTNPEVMLNWLNRLIEKENNGNNYGD